MRFIVVGAGVGGLSVASALRRKGHLVRVFDKANEFLPRVGSGVGISINGLAAVQSMGLGITDQFIRNSTPVEAMEWFNEQGPIGRIEFREQMASLHISRPFSSVIFRKTLIDSLEESLLHTTLHHQEEWGQVLNRGARAVDVHQDERQVTLTVQTEDGRREEVSGHVLIAADGIRSAVRKMVFGPSNPEYFGSNVWWGNIPASSPPTPGPVHRQMGGHCGRMEWRDGCLMLSMPCGPPGDMAEFWVLIHASDRAPSREDWNRLGNKEELLNSPYAADIPFLRKALQATPEEQLTHFGLYFRKELENWHRGRVILLGDSAHATLPFGGQGANMALEDAGVLSECIDKHLVSGEDLWYTRAFAEYESRRRPRTTRVMNRAVALGEMVAGRHWWSGVLRRWLWRGVLWSGLLQKHMVEDVVQNAPFPPSLLRSYPQ